jgi:hypothetical protein
MHSTNGMMKPGMNGSGIHQIGEPQLTNAAQPLEIRVFHEVKYQLMLNGDKSVYRVVDDFSFIDVDASHAQKLSKQS